MKTNKIILIAVGCLLIGLGIFIAGFAMSGFDIRNISSETKYQMKNFSSEENVKGITVDESNLSIDIKKSDDNKVHITYYENDKEFYEIKQSEDGILSIVKKNSYKWFDYIFNLNFQSRSLSLSIPVDYTGDLSVENSNSRISISDINANDISLTTSNGKITASNVVASGKIDFKTSNAMVEVDGVISKKDIKFETSNAQIKFKNIDFDNTLDCHTSNASIKGEIKGKMSDYSIRSKTSNGKNNLPENASGGAKTINIETSNSSIEVNFNDVISSP
ncbi:MAG: DUF4097 family beta strand repeat-containing protein [Saccharofermentanales bacterium]